MRVLQVVLMGGSLLLHGGAPAPASDCSFHNVKIDPVSADRTDTFVGKGKTIQVEFHNESTGKEVTVFPEPPLKVRQLASDKTCEIDGGVWARDSVFLSSDEKTLLVLEFSGDWNQLIAYSTTSCKRQGDIDVSEAKWRVAGPRLEIGKRCSGNDVTTCAQRQVVLLSKVCHSRGGTK